MKPSPARGRRQVLAAAVIALGLLSMFVPLVFILGLHSGFPLVYVKEEVLSSPGSMARGHKVRGNAEETLPEDLKQMKKSSIGSYIAFEIGSPETASDNAFYSKGVSSSSEVGGKQNLVRGPNKKNGEHASKNAFSATNNGYERNCPTAFGSYCQWFTEHKVKMKDTTVKKLKDQLFMARAYFPSILKLKSQGKLSREMRRYIQEHERMLNEGTEDADFPPYVTTKIQKMEQIVTQAKSLHVDCNNVDSKLMQILDMTEDEVHFHMRQSAFLFHLGMHTMPKSQHCLSMRLTVEYFNDPSIYREALEEGSDDTALQHYVIFSKNILGSSVTINSTVVNAKKSQKLVFYIVTDEQNFYAMKFWFSNNSYRRAIIHVLNIEDPEYKSYVPGSLHLSLSEEFHVSLPTNNQPYTDIRIEYLSVFGHVHFLLPYIFTNLKKVIVLDDDVVIQKDLSTLWNLNLEGKVNAAVHFCNVNLGQLRKYLGRSSFKKDSCAWMSGLNVIDLEKWREHDISGKYEALLQEIPINTQTTWRASTLPINYLAFQDLTYPLDKSWVLSGLGKDYGISKDAIEKAAALHYNGKMKPWLELGILKYKKYWKRYLTRENRFTDDCNVDP